VEKTEEKTTAQPFHVQEYLSLAYLTLIFFGLLCDVAYYSFFGFNILNYTDLYDVFFAPFVPLINNELLFGAVIVICIAGYFAIQKSQKKLGKPAQNNWTQRAFPLLLMAALAVLGSRIGSGIAQKSHISKEGPSPSHRLIFADQSVLEVELLGKNSGYLFYLPAGEKEVAISPIAGNIREIQELD
jgi:hypothetical protein